MKPDRQDHQVMMLGKIVEANAEILQAASKVASWGPSFEHEGCDHQVCLRCDLDELHAALMKMTQIQG